MTRARGGGEQLRDVFVAVGLGEVAERVDQRTELATARAKTGIGSRTANAGSFGRRRLALALCARHSAAGLSALGKHACTESNDRAGAKR